MSDLQLGLSFRPTVEPPRELDGRRLTIEERFAMFHRANPHVYVAIIQLARKLTGRGHRILGMKMLFEVLRYESMIQTVDTDGAGYKLNNDYTASYARLAMYREPDLVGVFRTRELTG